MSKIKVGSVVRFPSEQRCINYTVGSVNKLTGKSEIYFVRSDGTIQTEKVYTKCLVLVG